MICAFTIDTVPVAKARPRMTVRGGFARVYTPLKTRLYESVVAEHAREAMMGHEPYTGAVEVEAHFYLPVPKSWIKRDRQLALDGAIHPTGKPDLDNLVKAATDSMNGIVYADDCQIVSLRACKSYAETGCVSIEVREA